MEKNVKVSMLCEVYGNLLQKFTKLKKINIGTLF